MSLIDTMRERRAAKKAELDALLAAVQADTRTDSTMTDDESDRFDVLAAEIRKDDTRITELADMAASETRANAARAEAGVVEVRTAPAQVEDPPVYVPSGGNGNSYFRDMAHRALGSGQEARSAVDRLERNNKMVLAEQRALGNTNATGGSGGEFAPPQWLIDEYINIARPGRVTADLFNKGDVPSGVSSINIPKLVTGTSVAVQSTQNSALSSTDITSSFVSTGFTTLGGTQTVSQQIIDQSAVPFDRVVLSDLASAYATQIGFQAINGTGTGVNNNSVVNGLANAVVPAGNQVAFTQATPTAAQFWGVSAAAYSAFVTNRFAPPTCWLMHPRRWFWLMSKSDSNGRPLVVPTGVAQNPMAVNPSPTAAGYAGDFMGLPVYIDPQIGITGGVGTNQDTVWLLKADDLWLFESPPQVEAFREPLAGSVSVLFRMYAYVGTVLNRRSTSIVTIGGTGLVTPVFG